MKKQRGIALSLVVAMLVSLFPVVSVFAMDHLTGSEKASIELVYMQYKTGITEDNYEDEVAATSPIVEETAIPSSLSVGSKFLLGVRLKNMKAAKHAADGMYNMTTALFYDERYIKLKPMSNVDALTRMQMYLGFKNSTPLMGRKSPLKMGYGPSFGEASKTGDMREYLFTLKSTQNKPLFKGNTDELIAVIPVEITAIPPAGTELFTFPDHGHNTVAFGDIGASWTYSGDQMGVDPDQDVSKILTYDASRVNLFPAAEAPNKAVLKDGTAPNLNKNKGDKLADLDNVKLTVSYPTNPDKDVAPAKFVVDADGTLEKTDGSFAGDIDTMTAIDKNTSLAVADNDKYVYAYYEENAKKFLIKLGQLKVADPVTAITIGTIGAATYGDNLYEKLPANITATGGSVPNPAKADVDWRYKKESASDSAYQPLDDGISPPAGNYVVKATYPIGGAVSAVANVTVAKKLGLTVTADNKSMTFGLGEPSFTITIAGEVPGDGDAIRAAVQYPSFTNADRAPENSVSKDLTITVTPDNARAIWENYQAPIFNTGVLTVFAKPITLASVKLPDVQVGDTVNANTTYEVNIPNSNLVSGYNNVKAKFTIDEALNTATPGDGKTVAITKVGTGLVGTNAGCYSLTLPANAKYNVKAKVLTGIEKLANPVKALTAYKNGENLDLTALSIKFLYGADPAETVTLANSTDTALDAYLFIAAPGKTDPAEVTTSIANGAAVNKATMNGKALYIKKDGKLRELGTFKVKGKKAAPAQAGAEPHKAGIKVTPPAGPGPFEYAVVADGVVPVDGDYAPLPAGGIYTKTSGGVVLTANTPYDVYVRVKADAEDEASAGAKRDVTTYKNILTVKNASNVEIARGFVPDKAAGTIADKDALSALVVNPPAGVIEYYTAASMKDSEKINYTTFAITGDTTVYAKLPVGGGGSSGGGSPGIGGNVSEPEEKSLKIVPDSLSGLPGDTQVIKVEMKGISGDVVYTSSDDKVVTVDKDGNVKFVAIGTATITAEVAGVKAVAKVEVLDPDASLIDVDLLKPFIYGYPDGTFKPDASITRAEVSAIISRILKVKKDDSKHYPTNFTDVPSSEWYADYVGYLTGKGIIKGKSDTMFDPQGKLTRAEFVALLARAARFKAGESVNKFSDVPDSHWAKAEVLVMSEKAIVGGYPDGTFGPDKNLTRAEAAKIVLKMLKDADAAGNMIASDMTTDHWAYNEVLKAMNERKAK